MYSALDKCVEDKVINDKFNQNGATIYLSNQDVSRNLGDNEIIFRLTFKTMMCNLYLKNKKKFKWFNK